MFQSLVNTVTKGAKILTGTQNTGFTGIVPQLASYAGRTIDQFLGMDRASNRPEAVTVSDNQPNLQETIETDMSGSENPNSMGVSREQPVTDYQQAIINRLRREGTSQQANIYPFILEGAEQIIKRVGPSVVRTVKKNFPLVTGIGGAKMLNNIYTDEGLCSPSRGGQPFSVSKTTGCISVTRKQQRALKELVMTMGIDQASEILGLSAAQIGLLIVKKFPQRSRGVTGASMKTTRRTIRQLTRYAHDLDDFCKRPTPTRRRRTK